jgi:hypothetical protein
MSRPTTTQPHPPTRIHTRRHKPQARTAVGRWLNVVRNTQRMLLSWTPPSEAHLVAEFARWNAALTPAAAAYLCRKDAYFDAHCADLLAPAELAWLRGCANPPVKVLMIMSRILKRWGWGVGWRFGG